MRKLTVEEVHELHRRSIARFGGPDGLRNEDAVKSAVAQPFQTFGGKELYPSLEEKAAVIAFIIAKSHPYIDGNKRTSHAAMEVFLVLNGYELNAEWSDAEDMFQRLAGGEASRDELIEWIRAKMVPRSGG